MYKVRVFKTDKGRAVYAVTGFDFTGTGGSIEMAIAEVARYKKESVKAAKVRYNAKPGVIAPYKDGLDGLYFAGALKRKDVEPCIMVWKGQALAYDSMA
jgi:hypothetical protein